MSTIRNDERGGQRRDRGRREEGRQRGGDDEPPTRIVVPMWRCKGTRDKACYHLNFVARQQCHLCGTRKPPAPELVEQPWNTARLPPIWNAVQAADSNRRDQGRIPGLPPSHTRHLQPPERRDPRGNGQQVRRQGRDVTQNDPPLWHLRYGTTGGASTVRATWADLTEDEVRDAGETTGCSDFEDVGRDGAQPTWAQVLSRGERRRRNKQQRGAQQKQSTNDDDNMEEDAAGDTMHVDSQALPRPPAPFVPPMLPRRLLAARHKSLDEVVQKLEAEGKSKKRLQEALRRREQAKQEAKVAGGLNEAKLTFEHLGELRKIEKFEKAVQRDEEKVAQAEQAIEEARQLHKQAEATLEASRQRLANANARRVYLANNLAAEANADTSGPVQRAVQGFKQLVQDHVPSEGWELWAQIEALLNTIAPPTTAPFDQDPALAGFDDQSSDATSVADGDDIEKIDCLIQQTDLATARADLGDLLKEQDEAVAIALRTRGSQEQARIRFEAAAAAAVETVSAPSPLPATVPAVFASPQSDSEHRFETEQPHTHIEEVGVLVAHNSFTKMRREIQSDLRAMAERTKLGLPARGRSPKAGDRPRCRSRSERARSEGAY